MNAFFADLPNALYGFDILQNVFSGPGGSCAAWNVWLHYFLQAKIAGWSPLAHWNTG
jgi:hypothetical protein